MKLKEINYLFARAMQLKRWHFANKLNDKANIHFGQYPVLDFINKNPGCSQKELAEHFCVSRACVTKSVKRMINSGLLIRKVNGEDIRQFCLFITEEGLETINKARLVFNEVNDLTFSGFSSEELEMLANFVKRISNNLETDYLRDKPIQSLETEIGKILKEGEEE